MKICYNITLIREPAPDIDFYMVFGTRVGRGSARGRLHQAGALSGRGGDGRNRRPGFASERQRLAAFL